MNKRRTVPPLLSLSGVRLVGFAGPIGAGKTTAAMRLIARHGFVRQRFAGPLKDMMRAMGLSEAEIDGNRKEAPCALLGGRTPRWAMQTLGTEWGRNLIDPELWTTIFAARVAASRHPVVADDVRFPNEVATIHRLGGIVIRISRPGATVTGHASELQSLEADLDIVNDGTTEELWEAVERLLV